ncbi:MAG: malonic semialdehyde reductase [Alphaproteobacteria bacterium CG_4_9_14_3_um_filter_47_13]|nr:MAG: malonic semialdehyde reductase [Alphaproteobacteria bacterium CG_4_9_14_3_um_filter_47_13]
MGKDRKIIDDHGLDLLFREARTYNGWEERDVSDVLIQALYDLMKWGATSANCCPARFVFVKSKEAKEKLKPHLMEGNVEKTMAAPVTVIIGYDLEFYEHLGFLFPQTDAKSWFVGKEAFIQSTALRNSSLQGAYLMLAARALGLDCGPMSGFKPKGVKEAFFPDSNVEVNFICNLGFGDPASLHARGPRFGFDDVCKIV